MFSYRSDGQFVVLTSSGINTAGERQAVFDAIRSDPTVPDGANLIIDIRNYEARLTQAELQDRVRTLLDTLGGKIGIACAVIVRDATQPVALSFQLVAANMNFRVGVFRDEESARKWLAPYSDEAPSGAD